VTNFSKDQLDKIRALLEKAGVKPECLVCRRGTADSSDSKKWAGTPRERPVARRDRRGESQRACSLRAIAADSSECTHSRRSD
jgi:hypothetical protein